MVDNASAQLHAAAARTRLDGIFGQLIFDDEDVAALRTCSEGKLTEVRFGSPDGPIGVLIVDAYDSGNPEDEGLTIGLRGWRLDDGVASV